MFATRPRSSSGDDDTVSPARRGWSGRHELRRRAAGVLVAAATMTAGLLVAAQPAHAEVAVDQALCLSGARGGVTVSNSSPNWADSITITWHTTLPAVCSNGGVNPQLFIYAKDRDPKSTSAVPPNGSIIMEAASTGQVKLMITSGESRTLSAANMTVTPYTPQPLTTGTTVGISDGSQASRRKLLDAVATPNTTVWVGGLADLNLSGLNEVLIAPGVRLMGDRSLSPRGPRIFTYTFPDRLFLIGTSAHQPSDNVHVAGLRFDGREPDSVCASSGDTGSHHVVFTVMASQHVEIDNNEFYGWRGAGVDVQDQIVNGDPPGTPGRINFENANTVSVHDNYMHDNQHPTTCDLTGSGHGGGYAISLSNGAYVDIERNVFDRNRHAIAGHGSPGDGYLAFDNLFMHPGIDSVRLGIPQYNHQIDMHGLKTCGIGESFNCGEAGEFMDVGWNTVVFGGSDAIQLRGEPTSEGGMSVHHNIFAQDRSHALTQTVVGLYDNGGNVFDQAGPLGDKFVASAGDPGGGVCDFDRDGVQDAFRTTGATWWYFSSLLGRWIWLRESPLTAGDNPHDMNGDGRCDVLTAGGVFYTPSGATFDVAQPGNQVGTIGQPVNLSLTQVGGGSLAWRAFGLPPGLWIDAGTGRFGGTPTQNGSYLVQFRARDGKDGIVQGYFQWTIGTSTPAQIPVPFVIGMSLSHASSALQSAGLGVPTPHNMVDPNCNEAVGTVVAQTPTAGTLKPPGLSVHLEVEAWPTGGQSCN